MNTRTFIIILAIGMAALSIVAAVAAIQQYSCRPEAIRYYYNFRSLDRDLKLMECGYTPFAPG